MISTLVHVGVAEVLREATEAAAIAAIPSLGSGAEFEKVNNDQFEYAKRCIDGQAVLAMEDALRAHPELAFEVQIGEGEKDDAPGLTHGELLGKGPLHFGLAVDPIEGTTNSAKSKGDVLSVAAATKLSGGGFVEWNGIPYMTSIVVGDGDAADFLRDRPDLLDVAPEKVMQMLLSRIKKPDSVEKVVAILNRPRNASFERAAKSLGCRVILLDNGDFAPAVAACLPEGKIDIRIGIGGSPEAVLAASVAQATGGALIAKWHGGGNRSLSMSEAAQRFTARDLVGKNPQTIAITGLRAHSLLPIPAPDFDADGRARPHTLLIQSGNQL